MFLLQLLYMSNFRRTHEMNKEFRLAAVRKTRRVTQRVLAEKMASSQAGIYQMEHRDVLQTKSLRAYIEALGGRLTIAVDFEDGTSYVLSPFSSDTHHEESGSVLTI